MSEHEESAGSDPTNPGQQAAQDDTSPSSPGTAGAAGRPSTTGTSGTRGTRGQRAASVAGAVTSRTAGWMVAAALAGSLVTLLLDGGASQPASGQVAFRNVGRMAQGPAGGRTSGRIEGMPVTPKQAYFAPGGPLPGGPLPGGPLPGGPLPGGTVAPACAFAVPGIPPGAPRHPFSIKISGRQRVVIGKNGHRASRVQIGRRSARKQITVVRPGCQMMPPRCRAGAGLRIGQAPPFKRVMIKRHGRVTIVGPGGLPWRRVSVRARVHGRVIVVPPAAAIGWLPAPGCAVYLPASPVPGN